MATLDAKFMNCFFASKKLSVEDFRIEEPNELYQSNQSNQSNHSHEIHTQNEAIPPTLSIHINEDSHRYASFIHSRICEGVRMVDESEALLGQSQVQQLWTRFQLYELVAPIEDVAIDSV